MEGSPAIRRRLGFMLTLAMAKERAVDGARPGVGSLRHIRTQTIVCGTMDRKNRLRQI
jgi:hypothetical protein